MKIIISLITTAGICLSLMSGCSKSEPDPLAKFEEMTKAVCECEDIDCLKESNSKTKAWLAENAEKLANLSKESSANTQKRFAELQTELAECVMKLTSAPIKVEVPSP